MGCGWQAFVAYVNVGCYYIVGIPLGCLLGFYFDLGAAVRTTSLRVAFFAVTLSSTYQAFDTMAAGYIQRLQGIWSGMIGGTLMQTLILIWVTFRTNWNKEVCRPQ